MMTTKNFEKMNDSELDIVVGGTVVQLEQLVRTFLKNCTCRDYMTGISTHIPVGNIATAEYIESFMKENMHIDANISIGVGGTGILSKQNTYRDTKTGKLLSHEEVLKRAENYAA